MCSAPNVYMFVYILIGTHMVPLSVFNVLVVLVTKYFFLGGGVKIELSF